MGVKGTLKRERMFRYKKSIDETIPPDRLNSTKVQVGEDTFEAVPTSWYLGDMIGELGDAISECITAE